MRIPRGADFPSLTRPESFDVYAGAYWFAAESLFHHYWRDDSDVPTPDYLVMPVLFLLHHFIELELKEIIRLSSRVCEVEGKSAKGLPNAGGHSLTMLLRIAEDNLEEICPDEMPLLDNGSKNTIEDLGEFGSNGEGLRYPETTPKQGGNPTISSSYVANVRMVFAAVVQIRSRLNGCIGWLDSYLEYLSDRGQ